MKILVNDLCQYSDLDDRLKSPSLADRVDNNGEIMITFNIPYQYSEFEIIQGVLSKPWNIYANGILSQPYSILASGIVSYPMFPLGSNDITCIGIGGTDATQVIINNNIYINSPDGRAFKDGLYFIGRSVQSGTVSIRHNGSYMGRIALGGYVELAISPSREPAHYSSSRSRVSLSGAAMPVAGGYSGKIISVDTRYKIDSDIMREFERAYKTQTSNGFPFFIDFDSPDWMDVRQFYGALENANKMVFQSSINKNLYSKRFSFKESY